ncbi:MAG: hypothetical protein GX605_08380, partial [Chloroflexi bacterium]|nr:hypothetical protein [Chloroflexota bacterium]
LDETDYRSALILAGSRRGVRNVAKLLSDAHDSGIVGVGAFLEYIRSLQAVGAREGEARALAGDAVQIMSVHAAKGLEFPVVVIGDVGYSVRERYGPLLDPELGVLLPKTGDEDAQPGVYQWGKARLTPQEEAEAARLFYVAATRAQERLLLHGCMSLGRDNDPSRLSGWLKRLLEPDCLGLVKQSLGVDPAGNRAVTLTLQVGQTPVACTLYEPGWLPPPRAAGSVAAPAPAPSASLPAMLQPVGYGQRCVDEATWEQDQPQPQRVWRVAPTGEHPRAPAWVVGALAHAALAAWRFPDAQYARWAEAQARGEGLTDSHQLRDAVNRSCLLLERFRAHPLYAEMTCAERKLHEVPYSLLLADGVVENGVIDVLYLAEGRWTVVEFKTDYLKDEADLRERLGPDGKYGAQARRYVRAVEQLLGQRPRHVFCLLNYGSQVRLEVDTPYGVEAGLRPAAGPPKG